MRKWSSLLAGGFGWSWAARLIHWIKSRGNLANEDATMRKLKVGLIGYGMAGRVFHAPVITAVPHLQLSRVVERRGQTSRKWYPWVEVASEAATLFADDEIELIVVATPNSSHFELARQALLAHKHVVVDKPFTLTVMSGLDTPDDESRLPHGRFIAGRSQNDRFNVAPNMNRWLRTAPPTVAFEHAWQLDRPIRTDAPSGSAAVGQEDAEPW